MTDPEFVSFITDILLPYGTIKTRAMFGGYGVYLDGNIIGIIIDNELFLKGSKNNIGFYEACGSNPFTYINGKSTQVSMSYFKVLPDILEDEDELKKWVELAFEASVNSKAKKKK